MMDRHEDAPFGQRRLEIDRLATAARSTSAASVEPRATVRLREVVGREIAGHDMARARPPAAHDLHRAVARLSPGGFAEPCRSTRLEIVRREARRSAPGRTDRHPNCLRYFEPLPSCQSSTRPQPQATGNRRCRRSTSPVVRLACQSGQARAGRYPALPVRAVTVGSRIMVSLGAKCRRRRRASDLVGRAPEGDAASRPSAESARSSRRCRSTSPTRS